MLRDVAVVRPEMTRVRERSWDEMNAGLVLVHVGTNKLAIYSEDDELDYCLGSSQLFSRWVKRIFRRHVRLP